MMKTSIRSRKETDEIIERIASKKLAALLQAVDFSPIAGTPEWVVSLILPDAEPLLAKHPSQWRGDEIARLQESVDTLQGRMLLAVQTEPVVI